MSSLDEIDSFWFIFLSRLALVVSDYFPRLVPAAYASIRRLDSVIDLPPLEDGGNIR